MWLEACFSPLYTCVFPPALAISCSIFFAAFNGLISMFIRAYYLADIWNPNNILVERFTRVPNQIHLSKPRHCAREEVKQWLVVDLPGSSFQCFISRRTFKVYLQFKKRNIVKDRLSTDKQLRTTTITTKNPGIFQAYTKRPISH